MTNKDIMKLCLCSINYGKGITIDSTICSDGSTYYEVYAKHNFKNDNEIRIVCFGIYDFICEFVSYIKEHDIEYDYVLSKQTLKAILDDKTSHVQTDPHHDPSQIPPHLDLRAGAQGRQEPQSPRPPRRSTPSVRPSTHDHRRRRGVSRGA